MFCGRAERAKMRPMRMRGPQSFIIARAAGRVPEHPISRIQFRCRSACSPELVCAIRMALLDQAEISGPYLQIARQPADAQQIVMTGPVSQSELWIPTSQDPPPPLRHRSGQSVQDPAAEACGTITHPPEPTTHVVHLSLASSSAAQSFPTRRHFLQWLNHAHADRDLHRRSQDPATGSPLARSYTIW